MDSVPRYFIHNILISNLDGSTLSAMIVLLFISAMFTAGEAAIFSLSQTQLSELTHSKRTGDRYILQLLNRPTKGRATARLFATAQIVSYLLNSLIVLIILSTLWLSNETPWLSLVTSLGIVVLCIVLFTEVLPKSIAVRNNLSIARATAPLMMLATYIVWPLSWSLQAIESILNKLFKPKNYANISMDELSHALELTTDDNLTAEENKILEGIVTFGDKEAAQIMTSRVDVVFLSTDQSFREVIKTVTENGYSRLPVIEESPDNVKGFLVVKDLLPYLNETDTRWIDLIKPPFFVPENKKIDDLLQEFRLSKTHMAIVVDEYGGTSGVVTMEDILEEIVGDISDEFDDEEQHYSKLDNNTYIMEGKIPMVDVYKILDIDDTLFEAAKGDSSTLAGFVIEQSGRLPEKGDEIYFEGFLFKIEAADKRKIKRIKITLPTQ